MKCKWGILNWVSVKYEPVEVNFVSAGICILQGLAEAAQRSSTLPSAGRELFVTTTAPTQQALQCSVSVILFSVGFFSLNNKIRLKNKTKQTKTTPQKQNKTKKKQTKHHTKKTPSNQTKTWKQKIWKRRMFHIIIWAEYWSSKW